MNWYLEVLKKFNLFEGRSRRKEYWYFFLINLIVSLLLMLLDQYSETYYEEYGLGLFETIYSIAVFIPTLAVGIRRMHDVGKSGWYIIFPIYNIILAATEGEAGENEYGQDPKRQVSDISDHLIE